MSEKTLKFGDVEDNEKTFHTSKKSIALNLVDMDKIIISRKLKHNGSKYFNGYLFCLK